VRAPLYVPLLG